MSLLCNNGAAPMLPTHPQPWFPVWPQPPESPRWRPLVTMASLVVQTRTSAGMSEVKPISPHVSLPPQGRHQEMQQKWQCSVDAHGCPGEAPASVAPADTQDHLGNPTCPLPCLFQSCRRSTGFPGRGHRQVQRSTSGSCLGSRGHPG